MFEIQQRPYLWLAENNLACLWSFITGWVHAKINYIDEGYINEFSDYVLCYFDDPESTLDWRGMISKKCPEKTEEEKFNVFFDLLPEYSKTKATEVDKN